MSGRTRHRVRADSEQSPRHHVGRPLDAGPVKSPCLDDAGSIDQILHLTATPLEAREEMITRSSRLVGMTHAFASRLSGANVVTANGWSVVDLVVLDEPVGLPGGGQDCLWVSDPMDDAH